MAFCPVPHTTRDQVWIAVGMAIGLSAGLILGRIFKPKTSKSIKNYMPSVLSAPLAVVDIPGTLKIVEHVGNLGNLDDRMSLAEVKVYAAVRTSYFKAHISTFLYCL
jgi:hypothetical protein